MKAGKALAKPAEYETFQLSLKIETVDSLLQAVHKSGLTRTGWFEQKIEEWADGQQV